MLVVTQQRCIILNTGSDPLWYTYTITDKNGDETTSTTDEMPFWTMFNSLDEEYAITVTIHNGVSEISTNTSAKVTLEKYS